METFRTYISQCSYVVEAGTFHTKWLYLLYDINLFKLLGDSRDVR